MRITPIANLHGLIPSDYEIPSSDVLVIAGGILPYNKSKNMLDNIMYQSIFIESKLNPWLVHQSGRFGMVILTWGYTDILPYYKYLKTLPRFLEIDTDELPKNVVISIDSSVSYMNKNFFSIPWSNETSPYAFSMNDFDNEYSWNNIPDDTDILISHESPSAIFSKTLGSDTLRSVVVGHPKIKTHIFGHLHHPGRMISNKTYVNASYTYLDKDGFMGKDPYFILMVDI